MKNKHTECTFLSLSPTGTGVSGGDRIFIELAREWAKNIPVTIYTTQEGVEMCKRQQLLGKHLTINKVEKKNLPSNFCFKYLYKIYLGIKLGTTINIKQEAEGSKQKTVNPPSRKASEGQSNIQYTNLYSSSDFWMDVLPAVILKIRYPKLKWVATWYQTAPNPIRGFVEESTKYQVSGIPTSPHSVYMNMASFGAGNYHDGKDKNSDKRQVTSDKNGIRTEKYKLSAILYWLSQLPIKPLIKKYADFVIVNNEDERRRFSEMNKKGKVIVLLGAVRLDEIVRYKTSHRSLTTDHKSKIYSAVFQGRFHPQKGVVELIDIWRKVVDKVPNAKLAMIGDGPLFRNVEERIRNYGLKNNIKLFGYVFDGDQKYKIFAQSKIVVHPAFYDSGGMASAEAMAFGLPCVGFDLKAYESYYPKGMLKVKVGDINAFSNTIIKLLVNTKLRSKIGFEAKKLIENNYSWVIRSKELFNFINETK